MIARTVLLLAILCTHLHCAPKMRTIAPPEEPGAILHNPGMGWVVYENYPLDPRPGGSSTLVNLPDETFPDVDAVAIMFAWSDVETSPDRYDFSKVDYAYDHWRKLGKEIHLRMSAESLLWWNQLTPPSGLGVPVWLLEKLPSDKKQSRTLQGHSYAVVDARDPLYLARLDKFLAAVAKHFSTDRPVTLIDLRGFGVWGEWHTGFRYTTLDDRRDALKLVIDHWSAAFSNHPLALSYSHDPDGPAEYYSDDPAHAHTYDAFLHYSAFDYALTKPNITLRRDGVGANMGAVYSNQRKLNQAFFRSRPLPMMCEFITDYASSKPLGNQHLTALVDDALSLHPGYINLLGYQANDALAFLREQPALIRRGLTQMGYRLVPTSITYPATISPGKPFPIEMIWLNRGVARTPRDFRLIISLADEAGSVVADYDIGPIPTTDWLKDVPHRLTVSAQFPGLFPGRYVLRLRLTDPATGKPVHLPLVDRKPDGASPVGFIDVD